MVCDLIYLFFHTVSNILTGDFVMKNVNLRGKG